MSSGKIVLGVILHHDGFVNLALTVQQKNYLVAYLKSL